MPVAGLKTVYEEEKDDLGPHKNHPLYDEWSPVWQEVRDSLAGTRAIKNNAKFYIRRPSAFEDDEYADFVKSAEYPEAAQRTHRGTIDRVFTKPSKREVPKRLEEMLDRIDGRGLKFSDFERWCLSEACAVHRGGILADFDLKTNEPRLKRYAAENIFDWEFDENGKLVRLVLDYPRTKDGFYAPEPLAARQVLVVEKSETGDEDGRVWSVVYFRTKTGEKYTWVAQPEREILISAKSIGRIPFVFIGGAMPLMSILQPLVVLARHYVNVSADYRHQLHNSAFIQWWLKQEIKEGDLNAGITINDSVDLYGEPIKADGDLSIEMGSQRVLMLKNAEVHVSTPGAGTLDAHEKKLGSYKNEMVAYGARIFDQDFKSNVSADTVWMQNSSNATSVSALAELAGKAISDALQLAMMFGGFGEGETVKVELNKDYFDERFSMADVPNLVLGVDEGVWSLSGARRIIRQGGLQIGSDDEIEAEKQREGFEKNDMVDPANDPVMQ